MRKTPIAFTYGIEGKLHRRGKHFNLVMCEVSLPFMTNGDAKVLKALEYARASVWRIAVMQKIFNEADDMVDTSVHAITNELSEATRWLIANQCDFCVCNYGYDEPTPETVTQCLTLGDADMDNLYHDWTVFDTTVMSACTYYSSTQPLVNGVGVSVVALTPVEEGYLKGTMTHEEAGLDQQAIAEHKAKTKVQEKSFTIECWEQVKEHLNRQMFDQYRVSVFQ